MCEALACHGARVVISDKRPAEADEAVKAMKDKGLHADAIAVDLAEEQSVIDASSEILKRFGRLDVGINAATYSTGKLMEKMSVAEWEAGLKITLTGAFIWSRHLGGIMAERGGGSIIQFSSMYGKVSPDPRIYTPPLTVNPVDYGVGKAGLLQLVRYQAVAWGPKKVRVNAIVPGSFPTPANPMLDDEFVGRLSLKAPMGRVGHASEIAGAVVFLASDASSFVTGTHIVVDGGWTAW